jgi:hypothetical protein
LERFVVPARDSAHQAEKLGVFRRVDWHPPGPLAAPAGFAYLTGRAQLFEVYTESGACRMLDTFT